MNKVEVELVRVNPLTRALEGDHVVTVGTAEFDHRNLMEHFVDHLEDFRYDAAKKVAAEMVDYDSYSSDSDYLDAIDNLADTMYLSAVSVPNAETRLYTIEGIYSAGGIWEDNVGGSCLQEAQFNGLWTMASNDGFDLNDMIESGAAPTAATEALLLYMDDQELTGMCGPARPDGHEAARVFAELLALTEDGDAEKLREQVVEKGSDFIRRLQEVVPDGIVVSGEPEEEAPQAAMSL